MKRVKPIITVLLLLSLLFGCLPSSSTSNIEESEADNIPTYQNLSDNSIYTFSTSQTLNVTNNDGQRLTTPNNDKPVSVKLKDAPLAFGDGAGNTVNTTMF